MKDETCILCGCPFPAGLHVMGCLICFPCEKRLMRAAAPVPQRHRLRRLFPAGLR